MSDRVKIGQFIPFKHYYILYTTSTHTMWNSGKGTHKQIFFPQHIRVDGCKLRELQSFQVFLNRWCGHVSIKVCVHECKCVSMCVFLRNSFENWKYCEYVSMCYKSLNSIYKRIFKRGLNCNFRQKENIVVREVLQVLLLHYQV